LEARITREDTSYNGLQETQPVDVAEGFITFTKHFKYLDSYISYNLRANFDIEAHITAASQSMEALTNFWDNTPHCNGASEGGFRRTR